MSITVQYAEIDYPGSFMPETERRRVTVHEREHPEEFAATLPANAYAFAFKERTEEKRDGETLVGPRRGRTGRWFIGKEYTQAELVRDFPGPEHDILRSNIVGNGYKRAVLCRPGNWQPLGEADVVLSPAAAAGRRSKR